MANEDYRAEDALARELQDLRPYILRQQRAATMRPDPLFAKSLRARLVGTVQPAPIMERLRRVIATLIPPPQPRLALAGVRSAASTPQPATYAAEDVQVAISMERGATGDVTLRGMIFSATHAGEDLARTRAELLREETPVAEGPVDEFGAFILEGVPAGTATLQLSFPDRIVVISALAITG